MLKLLPNLGQMSPGRCWYGDIASEKNVSRGRRNMRGVHHAKTRPFSDFR